MRQSNDDTFAMHLIDRWKNCGRDARAQPYEIDDRMGRNARVSAFVDASPATVLPRIHLMRILRPTSALHWRNIRDATTTAARGLCHY
jgi:hypothetical protein